MTGTPSRDGWPPLNRDTATDYVVAYLDNELDAETARQVEAMLAEDPALRRLHNELRETDTLLPKAFGAVLDAPVPLSLARMVTGFDPHDQKTVAAPSRRQWWPMAMAAMLALAVIGGLPTAYLAGRDAGQHAATVVAASWLAQVADYHRIYGAEGRHLVAVGPEEKEHLQTWLSKRLGGDLTVPDLSAEGLTFRGGRMLVAAGKPVAQLMYTPVEGRPVGLCAIQSAKPDAPITEARFGDIVMYHWVVNGFAYVVVGWENDQDLERVAKAALAEFRLAALMPLTIRRAG